MRMGILTILLTGSFLSGTTAAFAECNTRAEAKALNPNSYLAYRVIAGARCWYAGYPLHRSQAATTPKTEEKIPTAKPEKSAERTRAGATTELRSAPKSRPLESKPLESKSLESAPSEARALGELATRPLAFQFRDRDDDLITGTVNVARSKPIFAGVQAERAGISGQSFDLSAADMQVSIPVLSTVPSLLPAQPEGWHLPPLEWAALVTVGLEAIILALWIVVRRRPPAQNARGAIIPARA